jgi:methylmalonyl-CoA mutase
VNTSNIVLWKTSQETIVGVNKYRLEKETNIDIRVIDNTKVRQEQLDRIEQVGKKRDNEKVY